MLTETLDIVAWMDHVDVVVVKATILILTVIVCAFLVWLHFVPFLNDTRRKRKKKDKKKLRKEVERAFKQEELRKDRSLPPAPAPRRRPSRPAQVRRVRR